MITIISGIIAVLAVTCVVFGPKLVQEQKRRQRICEQAVVEILRAAHPKALRGKEILERAKEVSSVDVHSLKYLDHGLYAVLSEMIDDGLIDHELIFDPKVNLEVCWYKYKVPPSTPTS